MAGTTQSFHNEEEKPLAGIESQRASQPIFKGGQMYREFIGTQPNVVQGRKDFNLGQTWLEER